MREGTFFAARYAGLSPLVMPFYRGLATSRNHVISQPNVLISIIQILIESVLTRSFYDECPPIDVPYLLQEEQCC